MRWLLVVLLFLSSPGYAKIGDVIEQKGVTDIERKDGDLYEKIDRDFDVESYDTVRTKNGRTAIEFLDETRVDVTENSKLVIDEFVYDPNTSTGSLALKASFGTVRYASGQIAKNSKQNVKISTPTAVIGVRGTDFSMTVDETGSSTIILLPSCTMVGNDLLCVTGEIEVSSDVGTVILNKAFQATVVDTAKNKPLNPILLDIDESLIGNLLIVRKPVEIDEELERDRARKLADFLGFDFLEFDELGTDYLGQQTKDIWMTELDIDYLSQNFLADILDLVNMQLARLMANSLDAKQGTQYGKDPETGIELYDLRPNWKVRREDGLGNTFELTLDQGYGYNINMQQNEFEYRDYQLGDGQNEIDIVQTQ
jgi:hypothetical protein